MSSWNVGDYRNGDDLGQNRQACNTSQQAYVRAHGKLASIVTATTSNRIVMHAILLTEKAYVRGLGRNIDDYRNGALVFDANKGDNNVNLGHSTLANMVWSTVDSGVGFNLCVDARLTGNLVWDPPIQASSQVAKEFASDGGASCQRIGETPLMSFK